MVGRFLRSYPGYTAEAALAMPVQRFWVLYQAIPALEATDDLRALMVSGVGANPGEKGQGFERMAASLQAQADGKPPGEVAKTATGGKVILPGITPGVAAAEPGSLRAERLAKRAAFDAAKKARYAE